MMAAFSSSSFACARFVRHIFEYLPGLAVEMLADGIQGTEADGLGLTCLENGEVGKGHADGFGEFTQLHLALSESNIESNNDGHKIGIRQ